MGFEVEYEMSPDPVPPLSWDEYECLAKAEYERLLLACVDDEESFQRFFERNPSFVPGAFEIQRDSGHYPYMQCLISQPKIGGIFKRKPDFLWLAQDSLNFCPVFIEIEKPSKGTFTANGQTSAQFTQAMDQIREWRGILKQAVNQTILYDYFDLPQDIRKKTIEPHYVLIYGRRNEYEGNDALTRKRAELQDDSITIMSYDRLSPDHNARDMICAKVSCATGSTQYRVLAIPPTFQLIADVSSDYHKYIGFIEAVDLMQLTSDERKDFLKERFPYWKSIGPKLHFFGGKRRE